MADMMNDQLIMKSLRVKNDLEGEKIASYAANLHLCDSNDEKQEKAGYFRMLQGRIFSMQKRMAAMIREKVALSLVKNFRQAQLRRTT